MSYYKRCECGKIYEASKPYGFPANCTESFCKRDLTHLIAFEDGTPEANNWKNGSDKRKPGYQLVDILTDRVITLDFDKEDTIIVGRNSTGAEVLEEYPMISRKHVCFNKRSGRIMIEDMSRNGTKLNGIVMTKGGDGRTHIKNGDSVTLYDREFRYEEVKES